MHYSFANPVGAGFWPLWHAALLRQLDIVLASRKCLLLLLLVLMVDAGLAGLDLAFRYAVQDGTELPNWFNLSQERSLGELFEYAMTGSAAIALAFTAWRAPSRPLALVAAALACITADNSLQLHETFGEIAGATFPGGSDVAELSFLLGLGLLATATLAIALRGHARPLEAGGAAVVLLLMGAAGFGIFVDLLHSLASTGGMIELVLAGIEDGGEMLFLTLAGAVGLCLWLTCADRAGTRESAGQ